MKTWICCLALLSIVAPSFVLANPVPRPVVPGLPPVVVPPSAGLPPARPVYPVQPPVVVPPSAGLPPARPVYPVQPPVVVPPSAGLPPARPVYPVQPPVVVVPPSAGLPPARPVYPVQPPVVVVPPTLPWPGYVSRPIHRPTPIYFPAPLPGSYRVLEGYAQPFNAYNLDWYQEYGIQIIEQNNGLKEMVLFPDIICSAFATYCPGIDKTPITLWVSSQFNDVCGGQIYYAYTNYSNTVRSVILTDNSRSLCAGPYQGILQLVVNHANGTQNLLVGARSY